MAVSIYDGGGSGASGYAGLAIFSINIPELDPSSGDYIAVAAVTLASDTSNSTGPVITDIAFGWGPEATSAGAKLSDGTNTAQRTSIKPVNVSNAGTITFVWAAIPAGTSPFTNPQLGIIADMDIDFDASYATIYILQGCDLTAPASSVVLPANVTSTAISGTLDIPTGGVGIATAFSRGITHTGYSWTNLTEVTDVAGDGKVSSAYSLSAGSSSRTATAAGEPGTTDNRGQGMVLAAFGRRLTPSKPKGLNYSVKRSRFW